MTLFKTRSVSCAVTALLASLPISAFANNGLYLIGYGFESFMMGGADVAVARDAFAANNNPAGMTQIRGQTAEAEWGLFQTYSEHTDSFGNYRRTAANKLAGYGSGAYVNHKEGSPYATGLALVVQGGIGWVYSNLNTAFGTTDDATGLFTVIRLSPAWAWDVNDQLTVGAAVGLNYAAATQTLFPNTSTAQFSGIRFKDASGFGLTSKWGLQYRPAKDVTIGVTYGTKAAIKLRDGTLRVNFTNTIPGQGVVRYDSASLDGLNLPEELAVGIAFKPTPSLLVSLQDKWYNWSEAIRTLELRAVQPRGAGAPPQVVIPTPVNFTDQHVIEIGFAYEYDALTTLYGGVNHGARPVPDQNTNPIFAVIQARHYTVGLSRKFSDGWQAGGGLEIFPLQSVTYDSPLFGPRANERQNAVMVHMSVSRRW